MNNLLSYSSLKLNLFSKDGIPLKPASGFVVEAGNQHYLITNRHVLSKHIPACEAQEPVIEPYTLKISIHTYGEQEEKNARFSTGIRKRITIQLYNDNNVPRWIEHQSNEQYQPMVDVVALPLQLDLSFKSLFRWQFEGSNINTVNHWIKISAIPLSMIDADVEYGPPDTVYIIGYPYGWIPAGSDKNSTAFWRMGSIASEINEISMTPNTFFIDPCAPEGMTGSPVIGMKNDQMKLLGVYSNISTAEFGANAGLVWDASLIKNLVGAS